MAIKNLVRKVKGPEAHDQNDNRGLSLQGRHDLPLSPFAAFEPFPQLRSEMNQLFDSYFVQDWRMPSPLTESREWSSFSPSMDVRDNGKEISIVAELPGMDEDNIDIELNGDRLTIRGEKHQESDDNKEGWHRIERRFGAFERTILLPDGIDAENVVADFKNGVLSLKVPRRVEAQVHRRKISIGSNRDHDSKKSGNLTEESETQTDQRRPQEHKVA